MRSKAEPSGMIIERYLGSNAIEIETRDHSDDIQNNFKAQMSVLVLNFAKTKKIVDIILSVNEF